MKTEFIEILLVEDERRGFLRTQQTLREIPDDQYKLSWVSTFEEGLSAILHKVYDIYLVDYRLGEKNGLDLLQAAIEQDIDCPFILLTDHQDRDLDLRAMASGAADFLVKEELTPYKLDRAIRYSIQLNRTVKALRKEKQSAQTYLEMAGSLIVIVEKDERVSLVNREGAMVLGYPVAEIIGKNWFDHFIPQSERQEVRQVFLDILNGNLDQREYYENQIMTKGNQCKLIRWYNRLLYDDEGRSIATISSGIDITQARRNERELQESRVKLRQYAKQLEEEVKRQTEALAQNQAKLKEATALSKIGYWEIDLRDQPEISWSDEFYQLYEVDQKVSATDQRYFLQFVHSEDREAVVRKTKKALAEGSDISFEYRIQTPTGKEKHLRAKVQCHLDPNGVVQKIFSVVQDITDQKKAALQLEQALQKEKDLSLLKSRFVSMASHEFRTPLTSILASAGLIEMYRQRGNLEKQVKHIHRIKSAVNNLTAILNDFLSLEKLESGKINFKPEKLLLPSFISEVKEELSLVAKEDQHIEYEHKGEELVVIDQHLVKNILINLLSNAIKYSPQGEVVKLITQRHDDQLTIQVEDHGIGIPEEDQKQMFSRFFRASNAASIKGTGLGLTIVKRYLDLMGGKISFVSKVNEGTTFSVEIPQ